MSRRDINPKRVALFFIASIYGLTQLSVTDYLPERRRITRK